MLVALLLAAAPYPIDAPLPGPESVSGPWLVERLRKWTPSRPAGPLTLECWTVPGAPTVIGVKQTMAIAAPIEKVAAIIEDFAHYVDLYPDVAATRKVAGSEDKNRFVIFTEQEIPVLPNVKVFNTWLVDRATPGRVVYRYKLREPTSDLRANDGIVVLEANGAAQTAFTEVDFIDAASGPIPEKTVWSLTLAGIYASDLALKLKAEHPGWTYAQVKEAREKSAAANPQDACYARRTPRP